jgi:isopentenyl-diphosphate delta-isomerase
MMPAPTAASLIDAVEVGDRPVGLVERGLAREAQANFRVVHVFVFDGGGKLLLQQLGHDRERNPLLWGSSVAGYLYASEAEWAAARRRLYEELGLETDLQKYGALAMRDDRSTKFITLFTTQADHAEIREPHHIERIEYRGLERVADEVAAQPQLFTPTFQNVFRFYWATRAVV